MEQFDAFFRRADLDQDGKISGAEAVGFFQGSGLPKQVLAQIWMHADQNHTGFLSRQEFYNALKLVTVAQSKRELTPEIVKAAIYGPASAKIPPPQINLSAVPAPRVNAGGAAQATQVGGISSVPSPQSVGFGGPLPPNAGMRPQYLPSQSAPMPRPPVPTPSAQGVSAQGYPRGVSPVGPTPPNTSISNDWLGGVSAGSSIRPITGQVLSRETVPTMVPVPTKVQEPMLTSSLATNDAKSQPGTGNSFMSDSMFAGDAFSATPKSMPQQPPSPAYPGSSPVLSSAGTPKSGATESSAKADPFAALRSTYKLPSTGSLLHQPQPAPRPNQQTSQVTPSFSSGMGVGVTSSPEQSQPWPKMTRPGIQKYAKVFGEVDSDKDGKISGEQARNLFLSWRLPREVLKQVWDLSDQDNDSMLSLREFCVALYLMERYREGRPLPPALPSSIMLDDALMSVTGPPAGPPAASYGSTGWGPNHGQRPQGPQQAFSGPQPLMHTGVRPGMQPILSQADGRSMQQPNARGPLMDNSPGSVQSNGEFKVQGASGADNKVESKENLILDYKEKLEYYRSKMQDLVLYKSRCDNRLNEITERARADKHEAESLGKKYEEKYKQVAEIASKLTIEEGAFRDTQMRKMELQQALTKMEQGGSADGILQVRADRIQSDLEELLKALAERCKKHGVQVKSAALIELPPGWQPGIPEIAAVWDEEWDKFNDEGFSFDVSVSTNSKMPHEDENSSPDLMSDSNKSESTFSKGANGFEADSLYSHSEVGSESPRSPQITVESPSQEYSDNHFRKSFDADSESHGGFDDTTWSFDNNDDVDSVWGFSAKPSAAFDSSEFGGSPTRSEISQVDHSFQSNTRFAFEDSVPGSPVSRAGNSPRGFSSGAGNSFFDSSSRFDSFSQQDYGSPRKETFTRFDSMNSTASFEHGRGFSFDDADPFGSSGPFKVSSSDSQTPKKSSDNWSSF